MEKASYIWLMQPEMAVGLLFDVKKGRSFPWLSGKNDLPLCWCILSTIWRYKFTLHFYIWTLQLLKTLMNKGFCLYSKNYEFDMVCTNIVPNSISFLAKTFKKTKSTEINNNGRFSDYDLILIFNTLVI